MSYHLRSCDLSRMHLNLTEVVHYIEGPELLRPVRSIVARVCSGVRIGTTSYQELHGVAAAFLGCGVQRREAPCILRRGICIGFQEQVRYANIVGGSYDM